MPSTDTHPPPSALRRALARLNPGRVTALASAIVAALTATGAQ